MDNITKEQLMKILVQRRWNFFSKEEKEVLHSALTICADDDWISNRAMEYYKLRDELANENVIL
jgi:hypothetical protein